MKCRRLLLVDRLVFLSLVDFSMHNLCKIMTVKGSVCCLIVTELDFFYDRC